MWSLYSPDLCSVRISTTVGKLKSVTEKLISKYSLARLTEADIGKTVIVACNARIAPVTYAPLQKISKRATEDQKHFRLRLNATQRKMVALHLHSTQLQPTTGNERSKDDLKKYG